jgi:hypothetical protein
MSLLRRRCCCCTSPSAPSFHFDNASAKFQDGPLIVPKSFFVLDFSEAVSGMRDTKILHSVSPTIGLWDCDLASDQIFLLFFFANMMNVMEWNVVTE